MKKWAGRLTLNFTHEIYVIIKIPLAESKNSLTFAVSFGKGV